MSSHHFLSENVYWGSCTISHNHLSQNLHLRTLPHTQSHISVWLLRPCLKELTELFFAYSRDKYKELSINALADSYTYPKQVRKYFKNGQWTVIKAGHIIV